MVVSTVKLETESKLIVRLGQSYRLDRLVSSQNASVGAFGHVEGADIRCELNYTHSRYIAEFINTLSNIPTIALGLYGAWTSYTAGLQKRFAWSYLGLSLIGLGSTGFHASLRWDWQLMDELPMVRTSSPLIGQVRPLEGYAHDRYMSRRILHISLWTRHPPSSRVSA